MIFLQAVLRKRTFKGTAKDFIDTTICCTNYFIFCIVVGLNKSYDFCLFKKVVRLKSRHFKYELSGVGTNSALKELNKHLFCTVGV